MSDPIRRLIHEFSRLPGVGEKTASRFVFHLLKRSKAESAALADAIVQAKELIHPCSVCFNLTDQDPCSICRDQRRDRETICVVEDTLDLLAIDRPGSYRGLYHVLGGALSPIHGVNPSDLRIAELKQRVEKEKTVEVIVATNPKVEGEATASYLTEILRPLGIRITRIAHGIPLGSALEYINGKTILKALENRIEI
jgi:recombination protein RecR